jgi:hypothetical protein
MTRKRILRFAILPLFAFLLPVGAPFEAFAAEADLDYFESNTIRMYDPNAQGACIPLDAGDANATSIAVGSDFSLGANKSLRPVNLVAALVKDYNLEPHQAAGVVGNFMLESGGNHVPPDVNEGGIVGPPRFIGGYGWAQWTGARQTTFIDYAVKEGFMSSRNVNATDAANYAYLNYELTETAEKAVIPALRKATNVYQAAKTWEEVFERAGVVNLEERVKRGNEVYSAYMNNRGVDNVDGTTEYTGPEGSLINNCVTRGSNLSGSVKFGNITFPLEGDKSVVNNPDIFQNNTTGQGGHDYTAYDILTDAGTKVVAFTSGVVTRISSDNCGSRLVTVYNKEADVAISYMHMTSRGTPTVGTNLDPGDQIGFIASVNNFPCVKIDHLHIDAITGPTRFGCATGSCPDDVKDKFIDIGPDLYRAYQEMEG